MKASLGLNNLTILQKKAENVEGLEVDLITSRAVTNKFTFLNITSKIKKRYILSFYKGSMLEDEIETSKISNYKVVSNVNEIIYILKEKMLIKVIAVVFGWFCCIFAIF